MTKLSLTWFARAGPFRTASPSATPAFTVYLTTLGLLVHLSPVIFMERQLRRVRKDPGDREDIQADSLESPLSSQPGLA